MERFISVVAPDRRTVEAYLYGGVTIVAEGLPESRYGAVLRVTGRDWMDAYERAAAQADRLASGLYAARTFETYEGAARNLLEVFGIIVP